MGMGDSLCPHCGTFEDNKHLFQKYARVCDLWDGFYSRVARDLPAIPSDLELLMLDFVAASTQQERLVVGHLGTSVLEVWEGEQHQASGWAGADCSLQGLFPGCRPFF
jgi:hypothetical protein